VTQHSSRWEDLLGEAFTIINTVNRDSDILDGWTFGGGTALMLQIDHRESHDIDLFLDDPQLLPYVEAAVAEMSFQIGVPTYNGDGRGHLKIAFPEIGEIDFIVTGHVTSEFALERSIIGRDVLLETISEIIAKKVRFRGVRIQPRDVFDIAAACEAGHRGEIEAVLAENSEAATVTAKRLSELSPDYVETVIRQLMIRPAFKDLAPRALPIVRDLFKDF
jgi:predicted nucleotidyltransferase component of viral defense system